MKSFAQQTTASQHLRTMLFLTMVAIVSASILFLFEWETDAIHQFLMLSFPITWWSMTLYGLGIIALSYVEWMFFKHFPIKGNINTLKANAQHRVKIPYLEGIVVTLITCSLTFLIGLPLGAEGPSVFVGAFIGEGIYVLFRKQQKSEDAISQGAANAFALVFLNPLVGFCYYFEFLEEKPTIHKVLKQVYLLALSYLFFCFLRYLKGEANPFASPLALPDVSGMLSTSLFTSYPNTLLLVAVFALVSAFLFKQFVLSFRNLFIDHRQLFFLSSTLLALVFVLPFKGTGNDILLGSGFYLIPWLPSVGLLGIIALLLLRTISTSMSYDLFYTGGQVIPTLAIGAMVGRLLVCLLPASYHISGTDQDILMMLTSLCFYALVSGNVFTASALFLSFMPSPQVILPLIITMALTFLPFRAFEGKSLGLLMAKKDVFDFQHDYRLRT